MNSKDLLRPSLEMTRDFTLRLAGDLRGHPMLQPIDGKGNHPLWLVGHLATIESSLLNVLIGEPNPREGWWPIFGMKTEPSADAGKYPAFDEVLATYRDSRAYNLALLEKLDDAALDRRPENIPPGFEKEMRTVAHTLQVISLHNMQHIGQLADCRRAAGLKPYL